MGKKPVKEELGRLEHLLKGDATLAPKQRLALTVAYQTIRWMDSLGREHMETLPNPSESIMKPVDTT